MRTVVAYTLRVDAPDAPAEEGSAEKMEREEQRVRAFLPAHLNAVEEDLEDLLPEGWSVHIKETE
jgi:hypothetical protein